MAPKIGVISVGGKGLRLGRSDMQKCLIEIGGKPILEYTVSAFAQAGVKIIFLLTGFLHEQVDDYLSKRQKGDEELILATVFGGTEGQIPALLRLRNFLKEDFLYSGGDCVFPARVVGALIHDASKYKKSVAIMSANSINETVLSHPRIDLKSDSSLVEVVTVSNSAEASRFVGMGMYYFRPKIFEFFEEVPPDPLSPTSEFIKHAQAAGETVAVSITDDPWLCLHTEQDLRILQSLDLRKLLS